MSGRLPLTGRVFVEGFAIDLPERSAQKNRPAC